MMSDEPSNATSGFTIEDIARLMDVPVSRARAAVRSLVRKGLIEEAPCALNTDGEPDPCPRCGATADDVEGCQE